MHISLCESLEKVIDEVRKNATIHHIEDFKICSSCHLQKPVQTKKCGNCNSRHFQEAHCGKSLRLLGLFDWLESRGLWPMSRFENAIPTSVTTGYWNGLKTHSCSGGQRCCLLVAEADIARAIEDWATRTAGLQLSNYLAQKYA